MNFDTALHLLLALGPGCDRRDISAQSGVGTELAVRVWLGVVGILPLFNFLPYIGIAILFKYKFDIQ